MINQTTPAYPPGLHPAQFPVGPGLGWQGFDPSHPGSGGGSVLKLNNDVLQITSGSPMWIFRELTLGPNMAGLSFDLKGINLSFQDLVTAMIDDQVLYSRTGFEVGDGSWENTGFLNTSWLPSGNHMFAIGLISQNPGHQVEFRNFQQYTTSSVPEPNTFALLVIGLMVLGARAGSIMESVASRSSAADGTSTAGGPGRLHPTSGAKLSENRGQTTNSV